MEYIGIFEKDGRVYWNFVPPPLVGYQTHKFSTMDAVERASTLIKTEHPHEQEYLTLGPTWREIMETLPQYTMDVPPEDKLSNKIGTIGRRVVYYDSSLDENKAILKNNSKEISIIICEIPKFGSEPGVQATIEKTAWDNRHK